jgi:hypothetical protein
MRRLLFALLFAVSGLAMAADPDPLGGFFTVRHGKIRQKDGTYRDISGLRIPFTVKPVGKTIWKGYRPSNFQLGGESDTLQKAYENDRQNFYFGNAMAQPSALDDLTTSGIAIGQVWQRLTVGWSIPNRNIPFIVWGAYDTFLGDMGPGNSAFTNIVVDSFGGPFTSVLNTSLFPTVPGDYMITFNIAAAGIVQTDDQIYFFQQFRQGSHTGPFMEDWACFFSGGGLPQIGSSEDQFWFDDPADGTYEFMEVDLFNSEGAVDFQANFAMKIEVDSNSTVSELPAAEVAILQGTSVSGNVLSTWSSNNSYLIVNNVDLDSESNYAMMLEFKTSAPSANIVSLQVFVEASSDVADQLMDGQIYNYTLGTWTNMDTVPTTLADRTITKVIGISPSQYVNPATLEMKLRVRAWENAAEVSVWRLKIDQVKWRVSTL